MPDRRTPKVGDIVPVSLREATDVVYRAFRESPAAMGLCTLWVAVFALMAYQQGGLHRGGAILPSVAQDYGSITVRDILSGEPWRVLTATWIHFNS